MIIDYHPTSKKYVENKKKDLNKALIISSIYTNVAYELCLKGLNVIVYDSKIRSKNPYRFINIPKYNIYEIKKIINNYKI